MNIKINVFRSSYLLIVLILISLRILRIYTSLITEYILFKSNINSPKNRAYNKM